MIIYLIWMKKHTSFYLIQPNNAHHEKVTTVTEDAASSCPLSQPWMWLLMAFFPSLNSQFVKKQFKISILSLIIITKIQETG